MMNFIGSAGIDIKRNTHLLKAFFDDRMVFIDDLLRGDAFFHGPDGDGHAMFITAANKFDISFSRPLVTYINICRYIHPARWPICTGPFA